MPYGLRRRQGWHPPGRSRLLAWRALGLSWKGLKHNRAFDVLVGNNAVRTALFAIFSPGQWPQATGANPLNGPQMPDGGRSPSCRPNLWLIELVGSFGALGVAQRA